MTADPFTDRIARVRIRFAATLSAKIDDVCAAIPQFPDTAPKAAAAVGDAYRCVHGIVGVGPTVGFPASGKAARDVEDVLRPPQQQRRGLSADEVARVTAMLQILREVAARELQTFNPPSVVKH
jgi:HPt (histidine-containing phosphotransfer) domain-containing protein